jgi:O-antigen/teichoic acid export membrane protein
VIIIVIGRAVQFILALAMLRVATTMLSPEEMGKVSLIFTTIAFFAMFLVNPVGMFINRRMHAWQASGVAADYLKRYVGYLFVVAIFAAISLPLLSLSGLVNFGISIDWIIGFVCISIVFNTINQTAIPLLNMLGDRQRYTQLSVATLAVSFLLAFLFVKMLERTAQYWVFGVLLGQTILAGFGTKRLLSMLDLQDGSNASPTLNIRHFQALYNFAWPVAIAAGLGWVQLQAYRYIMEINLGVAQLGLFVAGYSISAGLIAGFESILTTYFQPRLYKDVNTGDINAQRQAWKNYATVVIPSLLLTVALIMLLSRELTALLLGTQFKDAAVFVLWGAIAEAARVLSGVYSLIAHVRMQTRWLILPSSISAGLSVILSIILIPLVGTQGAGIALAVSGFIGVILLHVLLANHVGGGVSLHAILESGLAAMALCVAIFIAQKFFNDFDFAAYFSIVMLAGFIYLGLLYKLLRQHIVNMEKV